MKKSRKLLLTLGVVLSLALATGGTLAYLTDTDSDVNVMTLGNVHIQQIEKERIEQSDANTAETNVQDFTQGKPMYPTVGPVEWADDYQQWATGGSNQLFTSDLRNVVDKFVFVENTGNSDAYVRTWFAFEQGDMTAEAFEAAVGYNVNDTHWEWEDVAYDVEIDGNTYAVKMATYKGSDTVHPGGILPPGETTRPSLLQSLLYKTVTNEDCEALDGNGNGTYDIIVLSQAVQTTGFADAATALEEAFGEPTPASVPWETAQWPGFIYNTAEMFDSGKAGGEYWLGSDYSITNFTDSSYSGNRNYVIRDAKELTVHLNDKEITQEVSYNGYTYMYTVAYNGKLTLKGDGAITAGNSGYTGTNPNNGGTNIAYVQSTGSVVVDGGTYTVNDGIAFWAGNGSHITINGGTFIGDNTLDHTLIYSSGGVIDIFGGFFECKGNGSPLNVADANRNTARINVYGGTFVNQDPSNTQDPANILVAEGYTVVSETQANGDVWYTVVKQ